MVENPMEKAMGNEMPDAYPSLLKKISATQSPYYGPYDCHMTTFRS